MLQSKETETVLRFESVQLDGVYLAERVTLNFRKKKSFILDMPRVKVEFKFYDKEIVRSEYDSSISRP